MQWHDENAAFIVKVNARSDEGDIFAVAYIDEGGRYDLHFPSVYECRDVKFSDSYNILFGIDAFNSKIADGTYTVIENHAEVPYDSYKFFQPEFFDEVYRGSNPEIIKFINSMNKDLGGKYKASVGEAVAEDKVEVSHESQISKKFTMSIHELAEAANNYVADKNNGGDDGGPGAPPAAVCVPSPRPR